MAAQDPDIRYALGSVLNHVLLHQTVIGEEALLQLAKAGEKAPDVIVGCTGGGSNFAGLSFPFLREKLAGNMAPVIRAVEPASCPSLTRGVYAYDFGDTAGMTPLMKMHTLGHDFVPDPIHAGGLRYHGMSPLICHVYELGLMEAIAVPQTECFAAGVQFARTEGIIPAPEPPRHRRRRPGGAAGQGDGRGDGDPHRSPWPSAPSAPPTRGSGTKRMHATATSKHSVSQKLTPRPSGPVRARER
ncbi:MAG: pyridoxal-phosphate dependent enzyme [Candidatus Nanopelagicales bacterium]